MKREMFHFCWISDHSRKETVTPSPHTVPVRCFPRFSDTFYKVWPLLANSPVTSLPNHQPLLFLNSLMINELRFKHEDLVKNKKLKKHFDINLQKKEPALQGFSHNCFFSSTLQVHHLVPAPYDNSRKWFHESKNLKSKCWMSILIPQS